MIKAVIFCLAILLLTTFLFAQNSKLDSFDRLIHKASSDTQRINLEIQKTNLLTSTNLDSAIAFGLHIIDESKKINYYNGELNARQKLTGNYSVKGNYKAAVEQLSILEQLIKSSTDSVDYAKLYNNYGLYYSVQSKYDTSIPFYEKAMRILEHTKFTSMLTNSYNNIAIAYQMLSNYPMALEYYQKVSKISEAEKNEVDAAYNYVNMAILYNNLTKNKESEEFYEKAIVLAKKK